MICRVCNQNKNSFSTWNNVSMCSDCFEEKYQEKLLADGAATKKASDFKDWEGKHLSELFWLHLGKYQKEPNAESISIMNRVYLWAVHANHTLSNSIYHAFKWCNIDLHVELDRWKYGKET